MYRVLIVEDIPSVRAHIVQLLQEYHSPDYFLAGAVGNGEQAKAILDQEPIDLLLTDVFMPKMSGLELTEYGLVKWPRMKVVIISAYDHFEYVHTAMKLRAFDYLLKPIAKQEFFRVLDSVLQLLKDDDRSRNRLQRAEQSSRLEWIITHEDADESKEQEGIKGTMTLIMCPAETASSPAMNTLLADPSVLSHCRIEPLRRTVVVTKNPCPENLLAAIKEQSDNCFIASAAIGESVRSAWQQAGHLLRVRFLDSSISPEKRMEKQYLTSRELLLIKVGLQMDQPERINGIIRQTFAQISADKHRAYRSIWNCFHAFQQVLISFATAKHMEKALVSFPYREVSLSSVLNLEEAEHIIHVQFNYLLEEMRPFMQSETGIAPLILAYMKENLSEEIRLRDVASILYMNEDYVGRLFHKETGTSFMACLVDLRMEKAKQLLLETDIKITDIASQVGYNSLSNFIQTFRKHFGETPSNIRKASEPACDGTRIFLN